MDTTDGGPSSTTRLDEYTPLDLTPDRWDDVVNVSEWAFGEPMLPEHSAATKAVFPWSRARGIAVADVAASSPGRLVAVHCSFALETVVPGGARVPTSGLSWVGVHPGHRRRGLLRAMINEHFDRSLARGEYLSALFAAESKIYQRFGYGLGARHARATFSRGAELRDVAGAADLEVRLERLTFEAHVTLMNDLQRRVTRPGSMARDSETMPQQLFATEANLRPDAERMRIAIVTTRDGDPLAYALFKRKMHWKGGVPDGTVVVSEFVTITAAASRRLWGVLFDLDLTASIQVTSLPLDDRLLWLITDPRAPKAVIEDDLWVRILDVKRALEARAYARPMNLVIEVTDSQLPANDGRWRIATAPLPLPDFDAPAGTTAAGAVATGGGLNAAQVTHLDREDDSAQADISIGIQELSAAYLSGVTIHTLTEAGLVRELTPGASRLLSAAMQSPDAPMSSFQF